MLILYHHCNFVHWKFVEYCDVHSLHCKLISDIHKCFLFPLIGQIPKHYHLLTSGVREITFQIHNFMFLRSARKTLLYGQNDFVICLSLPHIKNGLIITFHRYDVLPWRRSHYLLFQWWYCVRKTWGGDRVLYIMSTRNEKCGSWTVRLIVW